MADERDWRGMLQGGLSRRALLRGGTVGAAGLAAAALIGCGDDDEDEPAATATAAGGGAATATATAEAAAFVPLGTDIKDPNQPYPYQFQDPAGEPKSGGRMVMGVNSDLSTLDTTKSAASGTSRPANMVYNRLLSFNRGAFGDPVKVEIQPELAKEWERSPDGLSFVFHLDERVKWQNIAPLNGRKFTAADVKFAYDRYASEGVHQQYYANVDNVEVVDDYTLRMNLTKAVADFLAPFASAYQSIHPRELVEDGTIESKLVGTGPWILKDAVVSERVTFDKNPDYWQKELWLDGVDLRFLPDGAGRLAAFRAGQIDTGDLIVGNRQELEALLDTNPDTQVTMTLPVNGQGFAMNLQNPKYQDERVRQAISLAIDRETILEVLYQGLGKNNHYAPWIFPWEEEPTVENGLFGPWTRFAPDEAMKLLAAAGAESLEMKNIFYPYSSAYESTPELLTPMFRDVGITMTGGAADYTEFNSQWVGGTLEDVTTGGWGSIGFDADNFFFGQVHSSSPGNRWRFNDAQIDEWAEAQQTELDPEARREIWQKMWTYELEQAYRPVIGGGSGFQVYQPWLRGIRWVGALSTTNAYQDVGIVSTYGWLDK